MMTTMIVAMAVIVMMIGKKAFLNISTFIGS